MRALRCSKEPIKRTSKEQSESVRKQLIVPRLGMAALYVTINQAFTSSFVILCLDSFWAFEGIEPLKRSKNIKSQTKQLKDWQKQTNSI